MSHDRDWFDKEDWTPEDWRNHEISKWLQYASEEQLVEQLKKVRINKKVAKQKLKEQQDLEIASAKAVLRKYGAI